MFQLESTLVIDQEVTVSMDLNEETFAFRQLLLYIIDVGEVTGVGDIEKLSEPIS